jgi:hypothetical protein
VGIDALGVQLVVEHFDPLLEFGDAGEHPTVVHCRA